MNNIKVEERREKVKELYEQGKTQEQIAEIFNVARTTITNDIKYLIDHKQIKTRKMPTKREKIQKERREKIKELYAQGKTKKQIAEIFDISIDTITNDINYLVKQKQLVIEKKQTQEDILRTERKKKAKELYKEGKTYKQIAEIFSVSIGTIQKDIKPISKKKIQKEKREKVKELYEQGKTQKQIAKILGVSIATISIDIKYLINHQKIKSNIKERREKIKELYKQGKTQEQIAKILDVSIATISRDIKYLIDQEQMQIRKMPTKREKIKKERREKVKELYEQGKTQEQISKILNVSISTIGIDMKYLRNQEQIQIRKMPTKREKIKKERREKVKELYEQGKSQEQIAKILDVSIATISIDIKYLIDQEQIQIRKMPTKREKIQKERREKIKELYEQGKTQKEIAGILHISANTIVKDVKILKDQKQIKSYSIEERREKVRELYEQGNNQIEIAKKLDVSQPTIGNDIKYLINQEQMKIRKIPTKREKIQKERREKVRELYEQGKTKEQMAEIFNVSIDTITNDIKYLINQKQMKIRKMPTKGEKIQKERREKIKELYEQGKTYKQIAEILDVSEVTISKDIKYLINHQKIKTKSIEERRKKVKEFYEQGKTYKEIAELLHMSTATISKDITFLIKQKEIVPKRGKKDDPIQKTKKGEDIFMKGNLEIQKISIEERRQKVKEFYEQKITYREMAKILHVSTSVICSDIQYLKERGEIITIDSMPIKERREKVKEFYEQGKTYEQMAKILNVSIITINKDIVELKEQGQIAMLKTEERKERVNQLREEGKTIKEIAEELNISKTTVQRILQGPKQDDSINIKKLYENFSGQKAYVEKFNNYIRNCKEKFKEGKLEKTELENIRLIVTDCVESYENIVFYLNVCIRFGQLKEANRFINSQQNSEKYTKEEKSKILKLKEQIIVINKKYIAMKALKRGEGIEQAMRYSGLPEIEVIKINKSILQQKSKNTTNDTDEKPNR